MRRAALMVMLLAWFALTWYFDLGYENADIGRYYLVPLMCVAIVGAAWARARSSRRPRRRPASCARPAHAGPRRDRRCAGRRPDRAALVPCPGRFRTVDESGDHSARTWLTSLGAALPQDAVIISWWSYSTPHVVRPVRRGLAAGRDGHRRPHDPRREPGQRCSRSSTTTWASGPCS